MVKTGKAVGDGVIEGTKVVGSGIVDVTEMTANAAVSGAKAATAATVNTVNATVDETSSFVREKKRSVNRHMRRTMVYTAGEGDTLGVIAAKYKTTCDDLIELNPQLAERRVQQGEEVRVPVGGSRKMSKTKDTSNFLQGLSMSFMEEDDGEGVDMAETRCLMNRLLLGMIQQLRNAVVANYCRIMPLLRQGWLVRQKVMHYGFLDNASQDACAAKSKHPNCSQYYLFWKIPLGTIIKLPIYPSAGS